MITKFSFRKETFLVYRIKLGKYHEVGLITHDRYSHQTTVSFQISRIPTEKEPAPFEWVRMEKVFSSIEEAKIFLEDPDVFSKIILEYDLFSRSDGIKYDLAKMREHISRRRKKTCEENTVEIGGR